MEGSADPFMESVTHDVIVSIGGVVPAEINKGSDGSSYASTSQKGSEIKSSSKMVNGSGIKLPDQKNISVDTGNSNPEVTKVNCGTTNVPNEVVRRRSSFLKSKSRLAEPPSPRDVSLVDGEIKGIPLKSPLRGTPHKVSPRTNVSTPKSSLIIMTPTKGDDDEDNGDVYKSIDHLVKQHCGKKLKVFVLLEWMEFISLISLFIASLTVHQLQYIYLWSFALWRWCVLGAVIFCSRLITEWFTTVLFWCIEQNFLFKRKVVYFMYGLKKSVQVFLWLGFFFLSWILLFRNGIHRSKRTTKILHDITMALAGCLVGAGMWLLKTLLIKTVALSFHAKRFFDRIQESLCHQYVLQVLSSPPLREMADIVANSKTGGQLGFKGMSKGKGVKEEVIDVEKLHKINRNKVSARTMKGLINVIRRTKLSIVSNILDNADYNDWGEQSDGDITSEWEAKAAAEKIFKNVAMPCHNYIEDKDLLCFMKMDEVDRVISLFQGAIETGKITKSALEKWVVNAYLERKILAYSLADARTAIKELNKIASAMVSVAVIITWNLMMGFLTMKVLVFVTSQLLLLVFIFGNTLKTVFEAIVFVFVMHPFDVGDRCVIDGVQMIVEEMNILTTIFLRYDSEKISYPNSVLATKPISNFYRSPAMSDSVEFAIDFSTKVETIANLKARIKECIESKPDCWQPSHSVLVKDILDVDKIMMGLYVTHTINFQDSGLKNSRRSDLVLELKKIFEELRIRYRLLPQEVHVVYAP